MGEGLRRAFAAARATQLNNYDVRILQRAANEPGEGWLLCAWIGESLGKPNGSGVRRRMTRLIEFGFMEKGGGNFYRITPAGRQALVSASPALPALFLEGGP